MPVHQANEAESRNDSGNNNVVATAVGAVAVGGVAAGLCGGGEVPDPQLLAEHNAVAASYQETNDSPPEDRVDLVFRSLVRDLVADGKNLFWCSPFTREGNVF